MKVFSFKIQKGFTLVEMLVAIAIFMIVVTTTMGAFLKMVDINKKVQSVRNAMDNANLAMETIMRNIRLGYDYCNDSVPTCTVDSFSFKNQDGAVVTYGLIPGPVLIGEVENSFTMVRTINGGVPVPITSPDIAIQTLQFDVFGSDTNDGQAHVKIFVKGKTILPKNDQNFDFSFQSLAVQRLYDK